MNLLLDTHALIWLLEGDETLSSNALIAIQNPINSCFVSNASLWEIAIKISLAKLSIQRPYHEIPQLIWQNGIEILPVEFEHFHRVSELPFYHKDPFDRIIIAQAIVENMGIVGKDSHFVQYEVPLIPIYVEDCALFFQCFSLEAA
ncbi:MAG: type II toxin-antitoxin system VapC family toxin [Candidatus Kapabacteria bacterium]|jgi:PIN domain nuclease of toxin-antitoxin system|nr:type II toxin-antitoxin system VapC family toxin [Candidatus Kapabacteria bacterium]